MRFFNQSVANSPECLAPFDGNAHILLCFRFSGLQIRLAQVCGLFGIRSRLQVSLLKEVPPAVVAIL